MHSLTTSDQHATLLVSHPREAAAAAGGAADPPAAEEGGTATASSLLKLTVVPFHRALLGSNPVLSAEDVARGRPPERNLLANDPTASAAIAAFLRRYSYTLKSESGAEYGYYAARPTAGLGVSSGAVDITGEGGRKRGREPTPRRPADAAASDLIAAAAADFGAFDVELISPASARQISRAMPSLGHVLVVETPEMYDAVVRPFIRSVVDGGSLSWLQNVIDGKKERERLLVDDEDFIVNVDTKWRSHPPPLTTPRSEWRDHPAVADLYCLGIVKRRDLACLRDLRGEHAGLLTRLERAGREAIRAVYGVAGDQVRAFVHYQPQFYHLHVHFTRLENEVGCAVERAHLLSDVVQNLESDADFYKKRTISYKLQRGVPLQNLIANWSGRDDEDAA